MKTKPVLVIACAILLVTSCKKINEFIPEHGGGHNNGPSMLKEVTGNTKDLLLYYDGKGLIDSLHLITSSPSDNLVFRYARHGNMIDSVTVTSNGQFSYVLTAFRYDDQGRIKDYMRFSRLPHTTGTPYTLSYDQQGNTATVRRSNDPDYTEDAMKYDSTRNMVSRVRNSYKDHFPQSATYAYDTGANPLYIKDIFLALLDFDYYEFIFSPNNATQKNYTPIGGYYSILNQYDSKNRLVKKTYTLTAGSGQGDTMEFRYY